MLPPGVIWPTLWHRPVVRQFHFYKKGEVNDYESPNRDTIMVIPSVLAYSVDTLYETVAVPIAALRSRNQRTGLNPLIARFATTMGESGKR